MQRRSSISIATWVAILVFAAGEARGDSVRLVNGDVVSGEILELDDDELVVDTDMVDEVRIEIEDIAWVETTRPFIVQYIDGTEARGFVVQVDGRMMVRPAPSADEETEIRHPASTQRALDFDEVFEFDPVDAWISYEGEIDVGINGASGNTDQASFNVSGEIAPTIGPHTLRLNGQLNRTVSNKVETESNWRTQGAFERELTANWSVVGLNSYEHDRFQDLDLRITAGAGPYVTLLRKRPSVKILLGPAFVNEAFYTQPDRTFAAALWSFDFEYEIPHPDVTAYHNHSLVVGLSDRQTIALTTTGVKWEIVGDLDLELEYQLDWNNRPTSDAEAIDQRYLVKIAFEFEGDENDWFQ